MGEVNELDRGAHADALGQRRRLAHQKLGNRQRIDLVDIDRLAMVLADIGVAKAEFVGEHDFGEVLLVGLRGTGVGPKAVRKQSEFHLQSLSRKIVSSRSVVAAREPHRVGGKFRPADGAAGACCRFGRVSCSSQRAAVMRRP